MFKHGRRDLNHNPLVAFAQQFGASVLDLADVGNGAPDLLIGLHERTWLVEIKTAKGALTPDQQDFIAIWKGSPVHIVRNEADLERLLRTVIENKRTRKAVVKFSETS